MTTNRTTLIPFFSGGSTNSNPLLSLGGAISDTPITAQSFSTSNPISGITVLYSDGNTIGDGVLSYNHNDSTVTWLDSDPVPIPTSGRYAIIPFKYSINFIDLPTQEAILYIDVDTTLLPANNQDAIYTIGENKNNLFPETLSYDAFLGKNYFLCVYFKNVGTVNKQQVGVYSKTHTYPYGDSQTYSNLLISLGRGNSITEYYNNSTALTIDDINTAPLDTSFATRDSYGAGSIKPFDPTYSGDYNRLKPNEYFHVWVRVRLRTGPIDHLEKFTLIAAGFDE